MMQPGSEVRGLRLVSCLGADALAKWFSARVEEPQPNCQDLMLVALHAHVASCEAIRLAFAEASSGARELHDPRFLPVVAVGQWSSIPYRVVPRVMAWTWRSILSGRSPLGQVAPSVHAYLAFQVARALGAAAKERPAGYAHGALTPSMIGVLADGSVRIAPPLVRSPTFRASSTAVPFAAPELLEGREPTDRADVYALARLLAHALECSRSEAASDAGAHDRGPWLPRRLLGALSAAPTGRPAAGTFADTIREALPVEQGAAELTRALGQLTALPRDPLGTPDRVDDSTTAHESGQVSVRGGTRSPARLRVVGSAPGRILSLAEPGLRWVIGRGRTADLSLDDPDVSREHFEVVRREGDRYTAFDLGSKNGLFVNGAAADGHLLCPGDEVKVGSSTLRFEA